MYFIGTVDFVDLGLVIVQQRIASDKMSKEKHELNLGLQSIHMTSTFQMASFSSTTEDMRASHSEAKAAWLRPYGLLWSVGLYLPIVNVLIGFEMTSPLG